MSTRYAVVFEKFTERHFIKRFHKKYGKVWDLTLETLIREFQSFDILFLKSIAETIIDSGDIKICKTEFKIAGTEQSRHGSGNRCIIALNKNTSTISVLLIYGKTDINGSRETAAWKNIIKENYPQYRLIVKE
jgi:hypothetical protein